MDPKCYGFNKLTPFNAAVTLLPRKNMLLRRKKHAIQKEAFVNFCVYRN